MNPLRTAMAVTRGVPGTVNSALRATASGVNVLRQLPELLGRVTVLVADIEAVVARVDAVAGAAGEVVAGLDYARAEAGEVILGAEALRRRAEALIDSVEPLVAVAGEIEVDLLRAATARLQPLLGALSDVDLDFAGDVADLVGRTRPLIDQVETLVMPFVRELRSAIPDVREILPVVQRLEPVMVDVETRIAGLPGSGRMRKRGEREIEEATDEQA